MVLSTVGKNLLQQSIDDKELIVDKVVLINKETYWKLGRDVVKTLIISDNQDFHGLIINNKSFDNQTVSLP